MKALYQYLVLFVTVIMAFVLTGCTNDDDIGVSYSEYKDAVVGEWYAELGEKDGVQQRITFEFAQDGAFSVLSTYTSGLDFDYKKGGGSYTVSGNKLHENYVIYGEKGSTDYEIRSVGEYDMHLFLRSNQLEEVDYRIVETIQMKVGETQYVSVSNPNFHPDEYVSDDELIVKVDDTGTVQALRQGTAYILIRSSIGTAVIRVVVETDTYIDDFVKYMGEPISVATKAYGNLHGDSYNEDFNYYLRGYFLQDDKVEQVVFIHNTDGVVEGVTIRLRELSDIENIRHAFYRSYQFLNEKDGVQYYLATKLARKIRINVKESTGIIEYYYGSAKDPFAEADDYAKHLASMTAEEIAAENNVSVDMLKLLQDYFGSVDFDVNDVFPALSVHFNWEIGKIDMMALFPQKEVTFEDLDTWYGQNYISTGYDADSYMYMCLEPHMYVAFKKRNETSYYVLYNVQ